MEDKKEMAERETGAGLGRGEGKHRPQDGKALFTLNLLSLVVPRLSLV